MRQNDFQIGEVYSDIIDVNGIAITVARATENGRPRMEHHRKTVRFGCAIHKLQFAYAVLGVIGEDQLVGG